MQVKYDVKKIKELLHGISVLTGIAISFLDSQLNAIYGDETRNDYCSEIQRRGKQKYCAVSDDYILNKCRQTKKLEGHFCSEGLYDIAMPITKNDICVGYIILGRIRAEGSPKAPKNTSDEYLIKLYSEIPFFNNEQLECLKTLLVNILFEGAITFEVNNLYDEITSYIKQNFITDLSVFDICNRFYISKNKAYRLFHENGGGTINDYIIGLRIDKAQQDLIKTDLPIYKIAEGVGIYNFPYFCRLFKVKTGLSPLQYRRENKTSLL